MQKSNWSPYLSPTKLAVLAVNGICLGASIVLVALGIGSIFLTLAVAVSFGAGAVGAYQAIKQKRSEDRATLSTSEKQLQQ